VLLGAGADVNYGSGRPLCIAAARGDMQLVQALLHHGADVCVQGGAPLQIALEHAYLKTARLLLQSGAQLRPWQHGLCTRLGMAAAADGGGSVPGGLAALTSGATDKCLLGTVDCWL
jgi:hypothetical protein